jgi:hypothetical protein
MYMMRVCVYYMCIICILCIRDIRIDQRRLNEACIHSSEKIKTKQYMHM